VSVHDSLKLAGDRHDEPPPDASFRNIILGRRQLHNSLPESLPVQVIQNTAVQVATIVPMRMVSIDGLKKFVGRGRHEAFQVGTQVFDYWFNELGLLGGGIGRSIAFACGRSCGWRCLGGVNLSFFARDCRVWRSFCRSCKCRRSRNGSWRLGGGGNGGLKRILDDDRIRRFGSRRSCCGISSRRRGSTSRRWRRQRGISSSPWVSSSRSGSRGSWGRRHAQEVIQN